MYYSHWRIFFTPNQNGKEEWWEPWSLATVMEHDFLWPTEVQRFGWHFVIQKERAAEVQYIIGSWFMHGRLRVNFGPGLSNGHPHMLPWTKIRRYQKTLSPNSPKGQLYLCPHPTWLCCQISTPSLTGTAVTLACPSARIAQFPNIFQAHSQVRLQLWNVYTDHFDPCNWKMLIN